MDDRLEEIGSIDEIKKCVESWAKNDNIVNISKDVYVVHIEYLLSLLEWTRVEDGLPENIGNYFASFVQGGLKYTCLGFFNSDRQWALDNKFIEVTHWMPLPPIPKEN